MGKTIFCSVLLLFITIDLFSQQTNPKQILSPLDYAQSSKKQQKTAWILAGTGTALMVTGAIITKSKEDQYSYFNGGGVISRLGLVTGLCSIPFFILSAKNKKLGRTATGYLKREEVPAIQGNGIVYKSFPALTVHFTL
jgi:hypothetical protein